MHSSSASKQVPCILWTAQFIPVYITAHHLLQFWARSIQSTHPSSPNRFLLDVLILSFHLCLGLLSDVLSHQNLAHTSSVTHMCPMPHPLHSSWFYRLDKICDKCKSRSNSVCNILWSPVTSPQLRPKCLPQHSILKHSQHGRPICAYFGTTWYVWHCLLNQMDASIWFNNQ
jgi:hypothetical protein